MSAPDAPVEAPYTIPPIPELYWDGIQFYLPAKDDDGTDGYEVMYLTDGGHWSYQGWTEAPAEDCPVVPVVAALAGTTTPTAELRTLRDLRSAVDAFIATKWSQKYGEVTYLRDRACVPVPPVVDPADSASAGGFGPEWDALIAWSDAWRAKENRDA